jgi:hypothetical protein
VLRTRAGHQRLTPAHDIVEMRQIDLVALVPPSPTNDRKVRDRSLPSDKFGFAEAFVEHAVKAKGFLKIALDAVAAVGPRSSRKWLN